MNGTPIIFSLLILTAFQVGGVSADSDPAKEGIDRRLPIALIIGDSISRGYTPSVVNPLRKAEGGCLPSRMQLASATTGLSSS
jgi:hypothetical protein